MVKYVAQCIESSKSGTVADAGSAASFGTDGPPAAWERNGPSGQFARWRGLTPEDDDSR